MNNNSTFAYVHTESGPIKPAKAVPIQTMKNIIASIQGKHVRGEKGTNWGELAKKVNKDCNPHGYTTIQTILNKALTEAATQAVGQSVFRLDLGNVVCDSAHAKFKMVRRNHSVIVDMLYPNDNGNITIRYNVDDVAEKMFELSLDSEHYINGFGNTIIKCCDDAIKEAEEMTEEDDIYATDENGFQPLMASDMRGLLQMTNAIMESDMGGGADAGFGEADFAAAPADPGADMGGGQGGQGGGVANLGGNLEGPDQTVTSFYDACTSTSGLNTDKGGSYEKFLTILADKKAEEAKKNSTGMFLTAKQIRDGFPPMTTTTNIDGLIKEFQGFYPAFKDDNPEPITVKEMSEFMHFLDNNDVSSSMDFDAWLLSNQTMKDLYKRKNIGIQGTATQDNMDTINGLPPDGNTEQGGEANGMGDMGGMGDFGAAGGGMGDMGGMGAPAGDMGGMGAPAGGMGDFGMPADNGMGDLGTDAAGADFGTGPDINDIGEVDKISENTSTELPNLGGESTEEQPVDENNPPV